MSTATTTAVTTNALGFRSLGMTPTIDAVKGVIADPSANPTLTILVIACAALVVILLAVFTLMLITPSRKRVVKVRRYHGTRPADGAGPTGPAAQTAARDVTQRPRLSRGANAAIVGGLALAAVVGGYAATSTDYYCARTCHAASDVVHAAEEDGHAPCVSCHEGSILNVVQNAATRGRMLARFATGVDPGAATIAVDSSNCLRCHRAVRRDTITSERTGVRMSHAEVLEGGMTCSACHASAGHDGRAFTATMSACIPCHDTKTASAECESCHTTDAGALALSTDAAVGADERAFGSGRFKYPAVRAAKRECGGCHDEPKTCDPCHGMRMPHSQAFKDGGHARVAAFERKRVCWPCHDPQECGSGGCHNGAFDPVSGNTSHGSNWKAEHARASWDGGCVCHSQRGGDRGDASMCLLCHAKDHTLLDPLER